MKWTKRHTKQTRTQAKRYSLGILSSWKVYKRESCESVTSVQQGSVPDRAPESTVDRSATSCQLSETLHIATFWKAKRFHCISEGESPVGGDERTNAELGTFAKQTNQHKETTKKSKHKRPSIKQATKMYLPIKLSKNSVHFLILKTRHARHVDGRFVFSGVQENETRNKPS